MTHWKVAVLRWQDGRGDEASGDGEQTDETRASGDQRRIVGFDTDGP